ncbi:hypothetical protein RO3G_07450 [Rhizopus delemar RA 99-880]|uniref:Uncharacterized protein n=1 Tax=Rhizopus delemar (strain RA 99-880 / ATCC MYA-4621 / FGSC 9543 / NRRL 43880) TaxID=246409 RepID=I1C2R5_RHIO9|nr:hypothetical protein RO3G_07450 [Rhizopus delemar RA 99-880]|eukprot:EIE82745.1 hypothetical protein RO3G_07450 [Rhizopus delemar RA 99-880]
MRATLLSSVVLAVAGIVLGATRELNEEQAEGRVRIIAIIGDSLKNTS